jgi:hypothetical protein
MTATIAPPVTGLRILKSIPEPGMSYLSVNLTLADSAEVFSIAKQLGFQPELVQMPMKDHTQIHALLWSGAIDQTPPSLDDQFDRLNDVIDPMAIRYASGQAPTL